MQKNSGFTLIELSIVLVIIGLIIGGILVGRDLIKAAEARAQIAQIEKYSSAVNTFNNKYGGIPGDLNLTQVTQFGFTAGTGCNAGVGARDGNGLLDGGSSANMQGEGETALFWQDLGNVNLIDGEFPNNGGAAIQCGTSVVLSLTSGTTSVGNYFPSAKMGYGQYVYVYESPGANWYGVAGITGTATGGQLNATANMPVIEAYNIDKKIDDGLPVTGSVRAMFINNFVLGPPMIGPTDTSSTCYNTATPSGAYSVSSSTGNGNNGNCALSFKFE
jgi:prepilin-type N-terminal cleavage/methylation domain-containing protein